MEIWREHQRKEKVFGNNENPFQGQNFSVRKDIYIFFVSLGWVPNARERNWHYRLRITYAKKEEDTNKFTCRTPRGKLNSVYVQVTGGKMTREYRDKLHAVAGAKVRSPFRVSPLSSQSLKKIGVDPPLGEQTAAAVQRRRIYESDIKGMPPP